MSRRAVKTTAKAARDREYKRRSGRMLRRPPEMVARHARELQELKDRQLAEAEEWIAIATHDGRAERAKERKLAKLKALAEELGVALPDESAESNGKADEGTLPSSVAPLRPVAAPRPAVDPNRPTWLCPGCRVPQTIGRGQTASSTRAKHFAESRTCEEIARRRR